MEKENWCPIRDKECLERKCCLFINNDDLHDYVGCSFWQISTVLAQIRDFLEKIEIKT